MQIRVKCQSCSRTHLVTVRDDQDVMEVKMFTCLSCNVVIKYRIGKKKEQTREDKNIRSIFDKAFGKNEDLFSQMFGGKK